MSKRLICAVLGMLALHVGPGLAQDVWIGRPTIGDYVRQDVHRVFTAFVELQRASQWKVDLTQDIAKARKAFFAAAKDPKGRAEVAEEFAELLAQKDLYYFSMYLTQGTDSKGVQMAQAIDAISKGAVDGGIFPEAFQAYLAWVNGVRASLGFSGDSSWGAFSSEALLSQDTAAMVKALKENQPLYVKYAEARDKAEIERFTKQRQLSLALQAGQQKISAAKGVDGSYKLDHASIVPLEMANHIRGGLLVEMPQPWNATVRTLAKNRTPVLECHYGPVSLFDDGRPQFETHTFWHATVPPALADFFPVNNGALGFAKHDNLDLTIALASCPPTNTQAVARVPASTPNAVPARRNAMPSPEPAPASTRPAASGIEAQSAKRKEEHQARLAAAKERQCTALRSHIQRAREAAAAVPAPYAERRMARVARMEQSYVRQCGD